VRNPLSPSLPLAGEWPSNERPLLQADIAVRVDKWPSAMDGTSGFGGP
jgi:hypothetical protein